MLKITSYQGIASQNHDETLSTSVGMVIIQKATNNKCGKDVEKIKLWCTVGVIVNWYSYYGKYYGCSSKN